MTSAQSDEVAWHSPLDDGGLLARPLARPRVFSLILLGGLTFLLACLALALLRRPDAVAPVWWANALAAGFLVRHARSSWPVMLSSVAMAIALANLLMGNRWPATLVFVAANLVDVLLMAVLVQWVRTRLAGRDGPGAMLALLLAGAVLPPLVGASLASVLLENLIDTPSPGVWPVWFQGAALGAVATLPVAIEWPSGGAFWRERWRAWLPALGVALGCAVITALAIRLLPHPFVYVSVVLVLAAVRLSLWGTGLVVFTTALAMSLSVHTGAGGGTDLAGALFTRGWTTFWPILLTLVPPLLLAAAQARGRRSRQQLAGSEATFRLAMERSTLGMALIALDGRILRSNPALQEMLGYSADELATMRTRDLRHVDDPVPEGSGLQAVASSAQSRYVAERCYAHRNGEKVWVQLNAAVVRDEAGRALYSLLQVDNVTEQRARMAALQASERFLRFVAGNVPGMLAYWDRDERCVFANRAFEQWLGLDPSAAPSRSLAEVLGPVLYEGSRLQIRAVLAGEPQYVERHLAARDGRVIDTWLQYVPDIEDGVVRGFFLQVSDVTELKAAQRNLADANAELAERTHQAESANAAKSDFLANMSHEIRTPMAAIVGLTHLLEHSRLNDEQQALLRNMRGASKSLMGIIDDVLDFSKIEAGQLQLDRTEFSLRALLDDLRGLMVLSAHDRALELVMRCDTGLPDCLTGDLMRLRQVLNNLLSNALKFTTAGEVVLQVSLLARQPGRLRLRFSVRDSGIGIGRDEQARLFQPFTQGDASTTRRYGGSGLGLAISRRLVRLMGGDLTLRSASGEGSLFSFDLSFDADDASVLVPDAGPAIHLLVAEDHALQRDVLAQVAGTLGWRVETVAGGDAAIERVRSQAATGNPFEVLVFDWKMPGRDGLAALAALRERQRVGEPVGAQGARASRALDEFIPSVVIMVAPAEEEPLRRAPAAAWVDAVLCKPVTAHMLKSAVDAAMARQQPGLIRLPDAARQPVRRLPHVCVLVVDDSGINLEMARLILEREGALVSTAGNGREALDLLVAQPDAFDVVLMDLQMPVMDGLEAVRRMRERADLQTLPVIALSAGALPSDRERAHAVGMSAFISKPFDVEHLVRTVRSHVERFRGQPLPLHLPTLLAAPADWPEIAGIDAQAAHGRMLGDAALFKRLLARLFDEFGDLPTELARAIEAGLFEPARQQVHKLRGVAGNLGAQAIHRVAAQLESALDLARGRPGVRPPAEVHPRIDALRIELGIALSELRQASASFLLPPGDMAPLEPNHAAAVDRVVLDALVVALQHNDLAALPLFESLSDDLAARLGRMSHGNIRMAIEGLRFEAALVEMRQTGLLDPGV